MRPGSLCLLALLGACGSQVDERDTTTTTPSTALATAATTAERPVILAELFTSQGCSSCPPADRLLSSIEELAGGVEVIPLAFHVDYWNDLGWRDPFSAAEWTDRQARYAGRLPAGRVYTPMLVLQGREHLVGSSHTGVRSAIARAAAVRSGAARIAAQRAGWDRISIQARAGRSAAGVWLALYESGLETEVPRGENRGRRLRNDFIVRRLVRAFDLAAVEERSETVAIALEPTWRSEQLGAVVFLQEPASLAIQAAARATRDP